MPRAVFEKGATNDKVVKVVEIHKPLTVVVTVTKIMFPHQMVEHGVVRSYLGSQIMIIIH